MGKRNIKPTFCHIGHYICKCGKEFTKAQSYTAHLSHCKLNLSEEAYNDRVLLQKENFKLGNENTVYFSRVENSNIRIIDRSAIQHVVRNAWIDIFPLDGMPDGIVRRKIHQFKLLYSRAMLQYSLFNTIVNQNRPDRPIYERVLIAFGNRFNIGRLLNTSECMERIDRQLRKYSYDTSKYVVNFMGAYKFKEMFPKEIYDNTCLYDFETERLPAPKDYNKVLTQLYGDYMRIPPGNQRNRHHSEVIEPSHE